MTATSVSPPDLLHEQLEPLRLALIEDATERATQIVDEARADADAIVAEATAAAENEVRRAADRARAAARARSDQRLDLARADAHHRILETGAAIRDRLVDTARQAALDLRRDRRYPELLDHLEHLALGQLGPDAEIERDTEDAGGVIGRRGSRRVDYTLVALADRALDQLGDEIEQLWT